MMERSLLGQRSWLVTSEELLEEFGSVLPVALTDTVLRRAIGVHEPPLETSVACMRIVAVEFAFIVGLVHTMWFGSLGCWLHAKPSVCKN